MASRQRAVTVATRSTSMIWAVSIKANANAMEAEANAVEAAENAVVAAMKANAQSDAKTTTNDPISAITLDRVTLALGGRPVLQDVSLSVRPSEFVGVLGPNG